MDDHYPTISYTEVVFERQLYALAGRISRSLGPVEITHHLDHMTNSMTIRLQREIYRHKLDAQEVQIRERPTFRSPRHAWVAHFPEGSFLRRFWLFFLGMDVNEPLEEAARVHTVRLSRWASLPDFHAPEGQPVYFVQQADYQGPYS